MVYSIFSINTFLMEKFANQNGLFSTFWDNLTFWKKGNFVVQNLCDKVSKIKNLRWQFRSIIRWACRGVFNFFCQPCFHGEIYETKWRNILKSDHFVLQISPWEQGLQKKLNTPRQSQQKILLNFHLRFFYFLNFVTEFFL